jgi:Sporulation and spore germination
MNRTNMKILMLLISVLVLSLSACGQIRDFVPGLGSSSRPTPEATDVIPETGFTRLMNNLRAAGAEVSAAGQVEQPFFPVTGEVINVNGASIQVFEFADASTRQQVSDTISANGDEIGTFIPSWIGLPNFWASESLIVLYLGEDQTLIDLLSSILGAPITTPERPGDMPPEAVLDGQRVLAQELNIAVEIVQLIESEPVEWTDACLGLGRADEGCLTVITPGWRAIFEVNGQRYEVRTDQSGDIVRWQQIGENTGSSEASIYLVALEASEGEVIGCGDALVPVEITLQSTVQPIKEALNQLLAIRDQYYGESGLYNALYQSNLKVDSVMLDSNKTATVNLSGEYMLGGVCDVPRFQAQLERTVTQYSSVNEVIFYINGKPLDEILSGAGDSVQSADFEGVRFDFPSSLAGQASGENVPASNAETIVPFISRVPEHIRFKFADYSHEMSGLTPQILVVSVEKLREIDPRAGNLISLLRTLMGFEPELLFQYMGLLPFVDTSQMMFAQIETVEFENGRGVRFLTQYNPGRQPINNRHLFYTFQGLTNDGEYYIAAVLPVSHPELPDDPNEVTGQERAALERDYPAYLQDITRMLDVAAVGSFTPDLTVLDNMIESLSISGAE